MEIIEFLEERLAEDRDVAAAAEIIAGNLSDGEAIYQTAYDEVATYTSVWSPERALADCEARERILQLARQAEAFKSASGADFVDTTFVELVLQQLATPYSEHPDYRGEWRPA